MCGSQSTVGDVVSEEKGRGEGGEHSSEEMQPRNGTHVLAVGRDGQTDGRTSKSTRVRYVLCSVHLRPAHRHDTVRVEKREKDRRRKEKKNSRHTFL